MFLTRDKLCSLIRKWGSLIEAHVDVKTTDGYLVSMFVIRFTKRRADQVKPNCYAQAGAYAARRWKP
jgi:small subunit ribosomal protein S3Ae